MIVVISFIANTCCIFETLAMEKCTLVKFNDPQKSAGRFVDFVNEAGLQCALTVLLTVERASEI